MTGTIYKCNTVWLTELKNSFNQHSTKGNAGSKKTRVWKNLKQIVAAEKLLPWKPDDVTCKIRLVTNEKKKIFDRFRCNLQNSKQNDTDVIVVKTFLFFFLQMVL